MADEATCTGDAPSGERVELTGKRICDDVWRACVALSASASPGCTNQESIWVGLDYSTVGTDGKYVDTQPCIKVLQSAEWRRMLSTLPAMRLSCEMLPLPDDACECDARSEGQGSERMDPSDEDRPDESGVFEATARVSNRYTAELRGGRDEGGVFAVVYYGVAFEDGDARDDAAGDVRAKLLPLALNGIKIERSLVYVFAQLSEATPPLSGGESESVADAFADISLQPDAPERLVP